MDAEGELSDERLPDTRIFHRLGIERAPTRTLRTEADYYEYWNARYNAIHAEMANARWIHDQFHGTPVITRVGFGLELTPQNYL